jgi:hypothetical protein
MVTKTWRVLQKYGAFYKNMAQSIQEISQSL